jgi:hypothetical protein
MNQKKLYQCPYNKACQCAMDEPCMGCEDFKPSEPRVSEGEIEDNVHLYEKDEECEHDYVYKIMYDHSAADICTKCGLIKLQSHHPKPINEVENFITWLDDYTGALPDMIKKVGIRELYKAYKPPLKK